MRALVTFLLLFALAPVIARAADATITCPPPTQFTDGTAIPANAAITYKLYAGALLDTQPTCKFVRTALPPGTYSFTVTATVAGVESSQTAAVQLVVPALKPNPPGTPVATISTTAPTAYSVIKSDKTLVLLPVGTIPLGSACDIAQGVLRDGKLFNVVDGSQVTYTGTARPLVVLAQCS